MSGKKKAQTIHVYADWQGLPQETKMGILSAQVVRGREVFSFEYADDWLTRNHGIILDPELGFYQGHQYSQDAQKANFGLFLDSSPDRWGRLLMRRRESAIAREQSRSEQILYESDYLLGVHDEQRLGALRFRLDEDGPFLDDHDDRATPPWTSLRELEHASLQLERDDATNDPDYIKWLNLLIAPGSSLGGARPKASIKDTNGHLWLAKFPSLGDDFDVGAWELLANKLALDAGIDVAVGNALKFNSRYHTYLAKRFDRTPDGRRLHFASAMTMLGYHDGDDAASGVSYLEFIAFLSRHGVAEFVNRDLEQLWRRIVFSICIANADDHLRNHGFLMTSDGWRLAPAYDINPTPYATGLKLNISEHDNALELDLARSVCHHFRVKKPGAENIISQVMAATKNWRSVATDLGIPRTQVERMDSAFRLVK